jgi:predicted O-methyltransferase YrrM
MNISSKFLKRYIYITFKDPIATITYTLKGIQGLTFLFLKRTLGLKENEIKKFLNDLYSDHDFINHIRNSLKDKYIGQFLAPEVLYILVRATKPNKVVETGVAAGVSSAFILKGLKDNNQGMLYSIDLPNYEIELAKKGLLKTPISIIPEGLEVGFAIPPYLKNRWRLFLGKSSEILPKILEELKEIDMFFHDSEHSYSNMMFEYEICWKHLKEGGLLLSDDIFWNKAFFDFAKKVNRRAIPHYVIQLGAIIK